jgi:Tol biopolymer transport system component
MRPIALTFILAALLPAATLHAQPDAPAQIAYMQYDLNSANGDNSGVYLINADGTNPRRLSTGVTDCPVGQMAFSPDGSSLTFIDSARRALVQLNIETGQGGALVTGLTDACFVTWHPGGAFLIYIDDNVTYRLDMTADSPEPDLYFTHPNTISSPAFSPDGALLAYVEGPTASGQGLTVAAADGSSPREVGEGIIGGTFTPAWHPNGEQLVVIADFFGNRPDGSMASGRSDILAVTVGRDRVTNLSLTLDVFERNASYSPDGGQLAYARCEPPNTLQNCDLAVSAADGSKALALLEADDIVTYAFPVWRPAAQPADGS